MKCRMNVRIGGCALALLLLACACAAGAQAEADFAGGVMYAMYPLLQAAANGADLSAGTLPPDGYMVAYAAVFGNYAEEAGARVKDTDGSTWISEAFARRVWEDSLGGAEAFEGFAPEESYAVREADGYRIRGIAEVYAPRNLDAYAWLALAGDRYALLFRLTDELDGVHEGYFEVAANERSVYGFSLAGMVLTDGTPQLTEWVKPALENGAHEVALTAFVQSEYGEMLAEILTDEGLRYELILPWHADVRLPAQDEQRMLYYDAEAEETRALIQALIERGARFALQVEDGAILALAYLDEGASEPPEAAEP